MPHDAPIPDAASATEYYVLVRGQIEHEDNLINQRVSWFVAAQSFLFTGYAIVLNAPSPMQADAFARQQQWLFRLIPLVAAASCVLTYATILAAVWAMQHLQRLYAANAPAPGPMPLPPIQGAAMTRRLGLTAPLLLPLVFGIVWLILLIRSVM